jgi:hypothetical protein
MSLVTLALLAILGLRPEYRPDACARPFATESNKSYCESRQERGYEWAEELAGYVADESERWDLDPVLLVAVAYRESSLQSDPCIIRIDGTRVVERDLLSEEDNRWTLCWTFGDGDRRTCQPAIILAESETDGWIEVDKCAYGEIGLYQLVSWEIPASYELPWGDVLERSSRRRRSQAQDPRTNVHLGARALADCRDRCTEDGEEPGPWDEWIFAHNTGRCRLQGNAQTYLRRVQAHYEDAVSYICEQEPEAEVCGGGEGEEEEDAGDDS